VDPRLLARDEPFGDPAELLVIPDHYVTRMLRSAGVELDRLGLGPAAGEVAHREVWRTLATHWHWFRGTPSRLWLEHTLHEVFGIHDELGAENADALYDRIGELLATPAFRPRALFERFGIEVLATTEGADDSLEHHRALAASPWGIEHRVISTFRPDAVVDLDRPGWRRDVDRLGELTGEDTGSYAGYVAALRSRREYFRRHGTTATDHGHPTAGTYELSRRQAETLFERARRGAVDADDAELFRGHMLMELAGMSVDDGLVMQLHAGSLRNYDPAVFARFGPDVGADIPMATDFVHGLRPLLNRFGADPSFTFIVFTLDESTVARELAPLAGHYPAMRLGPPWWFFDSPDGIRRFREATTETAGFRNTVGFNDDTRAFPSIAARHDVARRCDCAYLAALVARHRLSLEDAAEVAIDLAYRLPKEAYRL